MRATARVADGSGQRPEPVRSATVAELLQTLPGSEDPIRSLDAVLLLARASCPSCVAVSLTVDHMSTLVTVVAGLPHRPRRAASMTVRLPRGVADGPVRLPAVLALFATDALSLARLAVGTSTLLAVPRHHVTLTADARVPPPTAAKLVLARQLADRAVVDRALGALLEQGWLPSDGGVELQRRAEAAGASVAQAAATVLAALPGAPPRRAP